VGALQEGDRLAKVASRELHEPLHDGAFALYPLGVTNVQDSRLQRLHGERFETELGTARGQGLNDTVWWESNEIMCSPLFSVGRGKGCRGGEGCGEEGGVGG